MTVDDPPNRAGPGGHASRRFLGLLLLFVVVANLGAALAPFRLDPPRHAANGAVRQADGSLRFSSERNQATTRTAPVWLPAVAAGATLRLELVLRSDGASQSGPARILTVSADYRHSDLTVAQEGPDLIVRVRRQGSTEGGTPPFTVPDVFADGAWHDVRIDVAGGRLGIDVDGQERLVEPLPARVGTWDPTYRLGLGDEVIGGRSWMGQVRRAVVTVEATRIDYVEPRQLDVPRRTVYFPERLARSPRVDTAADVGVGLLHAAAFVPVGFLLVVVVGRRAGPLAALCAGLLLIVVIEQGKVFVAGRHPSEVDMAAYLLGGALGAMAARSPLGAQLLSPAGGQEGRT